jgi:hypothetical protein
MFTCLAEEVLLDSIDTSTVMGLRDRALIALMAYTFARIGAAVAMRVEERKTTLFRDDATGHGSTKRGASVMKSRLTTTSMR